MNAKVISIYAADTSGVCSALYELGGMTSHAGMTAKA